MSSLDEVFVRLRAVMIEAGSSQIVACDEPENLVLHTGRRDPKTVKPDWFGAVTTKKRYVSYHLMPLYENRLSGVEMSDGLAKRRQGKSCFNFQATDDVLFDELAELTRKANRC